MFQVSRNLTTKFHRDNFINNFDRALVLAIQMHFLPRGGSVSSIFSSPSRQFGRLIHMDVVPFFFSPFPRWPGLCSLPHSAFMFQVMEELTLVALLSSFSCLPPSTLLVKALCRSLTPPRCSRYPIVVCFPLSYSTSTSLANIYRRGRNVLGRRYLSRMGRRTIYYLSPYAVGYDSHWSFLLLCVSLL